MIKLDKLFFSLQSPNESTEPSTPLTVNAHADLDNSASAISTEVKANATGE